MVTSVIRKVNIMREQIEKILKTLNDHFGPSIFTNPQRFKAALADMPIETDAKKIRHLLNVAIRDMNVYSRLESGLSNNPFLVGNLVAEMVQDCWPEESSARIAIECIAELLYTPKSPSQPASQNHQAINQCITELEQPREQERLAEKERQNRERDFEKLKKYHADVSQRLEQSEKWKSQKLCPHCGGKLGLLGKTCKNCNKEATMPVEQPNKSILQTIRISFGKYDWRVLDVQIGKALVLSDKVIEKKVNGRYENIRWETSTLRKYLNGGFLQMFTREEQWRIIETRTENNGTPWYKYKDNSATNDKIFLLSLEEVVKYFGDSGDLKNRKVSYEEKHIRIDAKDYYINDQYNPSRIAKDASGRACSWWLRSPGGYNLAHVLDDGRVLVHRSDIDDILFGGVRPALWLNL